MRQEFSFDSGPLPGSAVAALHVPGPHRKGAATALAEKFRDGCISNVAAWVIVDLLRPEAEATVPILADGLKSKTPAIRRDCAAALLQIGSLAKAALPTLRDALKDDNPEVRNCAAVAVKAIELRLPE